MVSHFKLIYFLLIFSYPAALLKDFIEWAEVGRTPLKKGRIHSAQCWQEMLGRVDWTALGWIIKLVKETPVLVGGSGDSGNRVTVVTGGMEASAR